MRKTPRMDYRFKRCFKLTLWGICITLVLTNCISYRIVREVDGVEISDPGNTFRVGQSTMGEVLSKMGAPIQVVSIQNKDLLIYERSLVVENRISLGVPLLDTAIGGSADISTYGSLTRYDTLAFFFDPQGILDHMVFEKGSGKPYLKTLLSR